MEGFSGPAARQAELSAPTLTINRASTTIEFQPDPLSFVYNGSTHAVNARSALRRSPNGAGIMAVPIKPGHQMPVQVRHHIAQGGKVYFGGLQVPNHQGLHPGQ